MQADINRLVNKPAEEKRLDTAKAPPAIRSKTGLERQQSNVALEGEEVTVQSTDGVFTFILRVVK